MKIDVCCRKDLMQDHLGHFIYFRDLAWRLWICAITIEGYPLWCVLQKIINHSVMQKRDRHLVMMPSSKTISQLPCSVDWWFQSLQKSMTLWLEIKYCEVVSPAGSGERLVLLWRFDPNDFVVVLVTRWWRNICLMFWGTNGNWVQQPGKQISSLVLLLQYSTTE